MGFTWEFEGRSKFHERGADERMNILVVQETRGSEEEGRENVKENEKYKSELVDEYSKSHVRYKSKWNKDEQMRKIAMMTINLRKCKIWRESKGERLKPAKQKYIQEKEKKRKHWRMEIEIHCVFSISHREYMMHEFNNNDNITNN